MSALEWDETSVGWSARRRGVLCLINPCSWRPGVFLWEVNFPDDDMDPISGRARSLEQAKRRCEITVEAVAP